MEVHCVRALQDFQAAADWDAAAAAQADALLNTVLQALEPADAAYDTRAAAVERIERVLRSMPDFKPDHLRYPQHHRRSAADAGPEQCLVSLHVFGSFRSELWHAGSDLDLTITGRWRNRRGQLLDTHAMLPRDLYDMLQRITQALVAHGVAAGGRGGPQQHQPQVIMARVPLLMFTDAASGVAVDISVGNHGGVFKSCFTRSLAAFDPRFTSLYRLVKLWAEVHGLNDPKVGTLNSWSLTQMVIFHLQACQPAILPPLWQLFSNEPAFEKPRPLEAPQQQPPPPQQNGGGGSDSSSSGGVQRRQRPGDLARADAPYELLDVVEDAAARLQPLYRSASRGTNSQLLVLLAGFLVRFREVLSQWLLLGDCRAEKMSTWFGAWHSGGAAWRQEYLVGFEDPFDSSDNTARTLGTGTRNEGGAHQLLDALEEAADAITSLRDSGSVARLMHALFAHGPEQMQAPGYDPIHLMQQAQARMQQAQQARVQQQQQQQQQARMQHQQQQEGQQQGQRQGQQQQQQPPQAPVEEEQQREEQVEGAGLEQRPYRGPWNSVQEEIEWLMSVMNRQ